MDNLKKQKFNLGKICYKRIAITGHRPPKIGGYKDCEQHDRIRNLMKKFLQTQNDPTLISGGALGIDQFWIEVGLDLGLSVIAALPFKGYDSKWPLASRQKYEKLLDKCETVRYICEVGYAAWKLQKRNEWMVDNCDLLVAYWDGSSSGTKNCIDYSNKVEKGWINLYEQRR